MSVRILVGDVREMLATLPDESVHCVVTSPPYWGLRDYGVEGQLGLEATPGEFVDTMTAVFREVRRVLRADGTCWVNMGDSYAGSWGSQGWQGNSGQMAGRSVADVRQRSKIQAARIESGVYPAKQSGTGSIPEGSGLKPKDLVGMPWRLAFALQATGWVLRQEIIWHKPAPMPESVRDRCTKAHEQIFLLSKAKWVGEPPGRFAHISDDDARWLALLVDAEGCIVVKRGRHSNRADTYAPQVSIGNTSRDLMERVVSIVGHGSPLERPGKNCRMLYWQLANGIARDFLHRIYPFLIVKHRQARIGMYVDSLTYFRGGKTPERKNRSEAENAVLESLWARSKLCNRFGQPDLSDVPEPTYGKWDSQPYYFDAEAISEPCGDNTHARRSQKMPDGWATHAGGHGSFHKDGREKGKTRKLADPGSGTKNNTSFDEALAVMPTTRNKRSVWTITTKGFSEAHFATFPPELPETCIKAGSRPGDTVLDPFFGAGTTGLVADRLGRDCIGIELNPAYAEMARRRIEGDAPLLAEVS